ncbi:MAG: hypothetical protein LBS27_00755 [Bifidobacteriaceae bacterium]|jgi:hypothetical protein|nr:hypothetical protein [Bifidobacteriaceae bacterium]
MFRRRLATAGLSTCLLAGAVILAACSGNDEVATLKGQGASSSPADSRSQADQIADQARGAEDLVACLAAAQIPAKADPLRGDGQLEVFLEIGTDYLTNWGGGQDARETAPESMLDLAAKYDPMMELVKEVQAGGSPTAWPTAEAPPYLIIGQADRTADFSACLKSSGYTEPVEYPDPDAEIAAKQAILAPTQAWIECARANGFPNIEDPQPIKADEWQTQPKAVLSSTITVPEFRALLEACPAFNEEGHLARDRAMAELGPDTTSVEWEELEAKYPLGDPDIGFDLPGMDGRAYSGPETNNPLPENVIEAFGILQQAQDSYYQEHPELFGG